MTVRLTIEFKDADALRAWALAAVLDGTLPAHAGIRQADSLDVAGHRASPGDHIVAVSPGAAGDWLVQPFPKLRDELHPVATEPEG